MPRPWQHSALSQLGSDLPEGVACIFQFPSSLDDRLLLSVGFEMDAVTL
jgi:hypothetical protein